MPERFRCFGITLPKCNSNIAPEKFTFPGKDRLPFPTNFQGLYMLNFRSVTLMIVVMTFDIWPNVDNDCHCESWCIIYHDENNLEGPPSHRSGGSIWGQELQKSPSMIHCQTWAIFRALLSWPFVFTEGTDMERIPQTSFGTLRYWASEYNQSHSNLFQA